MPSSSLKSTSILRFLNHAGTLPFEDDPFRTKNAPISALLGRCGPGEQGLDLTCPTPNCSVNLKMKFDSSFWMAMWGIIQSIVATVIATMAKKESHKNSKDR